MWNQQLVPWKLLGLYTALLKYNSMVIYFLLKVPAMPFWQCYLLRINQQEYFSPNSSSSILFILYGLFIIKTIMGEGTTWKFCSSITLIPHLLLVQTLAPQPYLFVNLLLPYNAFWSVWQWYFRNICHGK